MSNEQAAIDIGSKSTPNASTYVKPQDIEWQDTRFDGISIKVLYQDKEKNEMDLHAEMGARSHVAVSSPPRT